MERGDQTLEEVAENGETALVRFTAATVLCALSRFSFHIKVPTLEGAYMVRAGFGPIVCIPVISNGTTATLCVMKKSKSVRSIQLKLPITNNTHNTNNNTLL